MISCYSHCFHTYLLLPYLVFYYCTVIYLLLLLPKYISLLGTRRRRSTPRSRCWNGHKWLAVHSLLGPRHSLPSVGNLRVADDSQLSCSLEFSTDDEATSPRSHPFLRGSPHLMAGQCGGMKAQPLGTRLDVSEGPSQLCSPLGSVVATAWQPHLFPARHVPSSLKENVVRRSSLHTTNVCCEVYWPSEHYLQQPPMPKTKPLREHSGAFYIGGNHTWVQSVCKRHTKFEYPLKDLFLMSMNLWSS